MNSKNEETKKIIKNRLKQLRLEKNLKQSELAEIVCTSQQTISYYENENHNSIEFATEEAIANYFSCSIDYLRGNSSIRNPEKYVKDAVLLKTEFQKLGILGEDEDIPDELLEYFRNLISANKPFLEQLADLRNKNKDKSKDDKK